MYGLNLLTCQVILQMRDMVAASRKATSFVAVTFLLRKVRVMMFSFLA
jgi:hypothetical protein